MEDISIVVCSDVSEQFEFDEDRLVYVDAPLEGIVRSRKGESFAFRCRSIIDGYLWHWVLIPAASVDATTDQVFAAAKSSPPKHWISIVEDRRGPPRVAIGRMDGLIHPIPL